jgi:hypothetical protein
VSAPDLPRVTDLAARYGSTVDTPTLAGLKARWMDVLDDLEATHRTAWLALFDGRLASLDGDVLVLDFSDATKLAGGHGFERTSRPDFAVALADSIERVTGWRVGVDLRVSG